MIEGVDYSVYPELEETELPEDFTQLEVQADYIARVCAAWDFGVFPSWATFELLAGWREAFDVYPVPTSVAYHTFRSLFGWPPVESEVWEADYEQHDRVEGRRDPWLEWI